ncbi:MAG: PLP-dependent aminotransferase family protein [Coriobacteriia bacterium]|nr:PLP-dependent aminotransferase family protein [Coriobacteriia bacterium]
MDHNLTCPLYRQIYDQVKQLIVSGAYPAGTKLMPIRKLAEELTISRNTVEAAYLQLSSEGYISSRTGSGFTVESLYLSNPVIQLDENESSESFRLRLRQTALWGDGTDGAEASLAESAPKVSTLYDFTYGNLEDNSFPSQVWRKLTADVLMSEGSAKASYYTDSLGERGLRVQIANYLHIHAGVNCHPAQVVIQGGTQPSLLNLLTLFDPLRDVIAMEQPGYDGVFSVFKNNRFKLFPIPVYKSNDDFIEALYNSHARLAYVTPSNQFPTGKTLPLAIRQRLLRWANEENAYIIEDDYCREYRYNTGPLPSLQALDHNNRVIYMGTFSKALSPALRLNYLVLPPDLLFEWNRQFDCNYAGVPWLTQAVLEEYMKQGYWDKRLRKMQTVNKRKYTLLKSVLQERMGAKIDIRESGSGLHLLVGDLMQRRQSDLVDLARREGVLVYNTNRYWISSRHPMENYVLVGFSAIPECSIEPGIEALARAWYGL